MTSQKPLKIHEPGKIDIHNRKDKFIRSIEKLNSNNTMIKENKDLILNFIRDCQLGKTIKNKSKKKIGSARCSKYISILQRLSNCFNKSFNDIIQKDIEHFIINLENDKISSAKGKPFSEATKLDYKNTIKKFWKWKDGNNRLFPELVDWIDTSITIKEIPALSRPEIEQMIENAGNPREKALIMVLFDSGARIEELLNVRLRKEHLFWKPELGCYMIRLEYSKTKPRTISIPLCSDLINKWLKIHPARDNAQAQLFPMTYDSVRMYLHRQGKKILGKIINPHLFRHSSATYYANKLNRYQLCYRYGWAMSSKQVDRYIDREGIIEESTAKIIQSDEISKVSNENQAFKEEIILLKESCKELGVKYNELKSQLYSIQSGRGILNILMKVFSQHENLANNIKHFSTKK